MPSARRPPYGRFNLQVFVETGPHSIPVRAAFQEVTGLDTESTLAEYRPGQPQRSARAKLKGLHKTPSVTLKRGVLSAWTAMARWLEAGTGAERCTVRIELTGEEPSRVVRAWTLRNVLPIKYVGPALSAEGTDVAIEELVLSAEGIELE